jgi:hypothetical protein
MRYVQLFIDSLRYYSQYFITIGSFTAIAAITRAVQLGAFGQVSHATYSSLELLVSTARTLMSLAILGGGSPLRGLKRLIHLDFRIPEIPRKKWQTIISQRWIVLTANLLVFAVAAVVCNALLRATATLIADHTSIGFLSNQEANDFFLKNMTVIPLTTVFALCCINFVFFAKAKRSTR